MPAEFHPTVYAAVCAGLCVWFAGVWLWARHRDNWSVVDTAWSLTPPLFAAIPTFAFGAPGVRGSAVFVLLVIWGVRLASHLHGRVKGGRKNEDPRYAAMREAWGAEVGRKMFWFYQIQAVTTWVLVLPVFLVRRDEAPYPAWYDMAGVALVLFAWCGETLADSQLKKFRAAPANRGKICEVGLWAYSRHPNYFFEWLIWCGFALACAGTTLGALAWLAPVMMYALLRYASGVPMLEERALRTKGDAWRDYSRRVSVFFPLPPER